MLAAALFCTGCAAAANWWSRVRPIGHLEAISKPLTTILVIWIAVAADGPRLATTLAVMALILCLVGDVALLDVIDRFIVGLAAFLVGHLLFVAMAVALHLERPWWGLIAFGFVAVVARVVAVPIITGATMREPKMRYPVIAYFAVISIMAIVTTMTGRWWAIAGAWCFVVSDALLGRRQFVRDHRWMAPWVMITYHAALVGLALSLRA